MFSAVNKITLEPSEISSQNFYKTKVHGQKLNLENGCIPMHCGVRMVT